MARPEPMISVVIPTFNREAPLCRCLDDVLRQRFPRFEILVVDQTAQHEPATEAFLEQVREQIRHIKSRRIGLMPALNLALELARGEILWLTDDDARIPDGGLLDIHMREYDDQTIGGVAGFEDDPRRPSGSAYDPRSADPTWGWYFSRWDHPVRADVVAAPGCNVSFRREVLRRAGGFDETLTGNAVRWENDLCLRVRRAGYRVVFVPEARVVHQPSASVGGCDNRHLLGRDEGAHAWYVSYFRNMAYVTMKHMPPQTWPRVLWKLWRQHVCNRPFLSFGPMFQIQRHHAFLRGLRQGIAAWHGSR